MSRKDKESPPCQVALSSPTQVCHYYLCDTTNCQHPTDGHTSSGQLPVYDTRELLLRLLSYGHDGLWVVAEAGCGRVVMSRVYTVHNVSFALMMQCFHSLQDLFYSIHCTVHGLLTIPPTNHCTCMYLTAL